MKKTIFITGSTDGIGKLTAIKLAEQGHNVILHGRNERKLHTINKEIKDKYPDSILNSYVTDLSNIESIKIMASELAKDISHIDVVINNAGVYQSKDKYASNGLDLRFMVNYLAPYFLTHNLLKAFGEPKPIQRIINLSSAAQSSIDINALKGKQSLSNSESYAQSKLALTIWSFYLAKKQPSTTIIAVNPGSLLNTKMVQEAFGKHWSPVNKGADILYDMAINDKYENYSGQYFDNDLGSFNTAHSDAYDTQKINTLIQETESLILSL